MMRALLSIAVNKGQDHFQLDVANAFLNGELHEEMYIDVLLGLAVEKPELVCKLKKFLYGLKQASRQWYVKLTKIYVLGDIFTQYMTTFYSLRQMALQLCLWQFMWMM